MQKLVECVPNFSEGRSPDAIDAITHAIQSTAGALLLDVDPGKETNRTVVTFVGEPDVVMEAAFRAIKTASAVIDMRTHKGAHPRIGATDVCPFVPVTGVTHAECIELAKRLAQRVGAELGIPVYLYGYAATRPERQKLPDIRAGEYEALPEKLIQPDWQPDYGPATFNAKSGATVIGVRDFLLAYNVNLNTRDPQRAKDIAMVIRESGRPKRDQAGNIMHDPDGNTIKEPGKLRFCQATGWYIPEYGYAQVSMNLHRFQVTGLHTAFDAVCAEARRLGLHVTGSELVGLTPKQALLDAGIHYLKKMGKSSGVPEEEILHTAILSLGLNATSPFRLAEKVIEFKIDQHPGKLAGLTVKDFANELSSASPAPGGGSVAALCGALSAGLASMVANLTFGKKGYIHSNRTMEEVAVKAQALKTLFLELIDRDTDAFNAFMEAMRLPRKTLEEQQARSLALTEAAKHAALVPFETLQCAHDVIALTQIVAQKGNVNARSDAAVSALTAEAAAEGAYLNIMTNLSSIKDQAFTQKIKVEADALLARVKRDRKRIMRRVLKNICPP